MKRRTDPAKITKFSLLGLGILAIVIIVILDFNGLYGQDSYAYYGFSRVITNYFLGDADMVGFYWTIMYPMTGGILQLLTGESPYVLQAISLLSHVGSTFFLLKYVEKNHRDDAATILIIVGFLFCPVLLKNSFQIMSEPLVIFLLCGSIYHFKEYSKHSQLKNLTYWSLFAAFAIFTKYPIAILLIPQALYICTRIIKTGKYQYLGIGLFAIVFASVPEVLISERLNGNAGLFDNYFLNKWSISNLFQRSFLTADGTQIYSLPNIIFASKLFWYPIFFLPFLVLLFWSKTKDFFKPMQLLMVSSIVLYLTFVSGFPFQNIRILVPAFPFLIILILPSFIRFWNWERIAQFTTLRNYTILLFLAAQLLMSLYLINVFAKTNHLEKQMAKYVQSMNNDRYYGFEVDVAINSYLDNSEKMENLITELHEFKNGDVLFFNKDRFDLVWTKSNVNTNLQRALLHHDTIKIHSFENKWTVYQLNKR